MNVYPLKKRWHKIRPFLVHPEAQAVENRVMKLLHPEYEAGTHIPREAGRCFVSGWPRSRRGATAFQCFGHCHSISPLMHTLLSHAEPQKQWFIFTAPAHTTVVELAGFPAFTPLADLTFERIRDLVSRTTADVRELIVQVCDVNSCHGPDESILEQFEDEILTSSEGYEIYSNVDEYIQEHLVDETGKGVYADGYKMHPRAEWGRAQSFLTKEQKKIRSSAKISKPVYGRKHKTEDEWVEYASMSAAARQLDLHQGSISGVTKGKQHQTGGYEFKLKPQA